MNKLRLIPAFLLFGFVMLSVRAEIIYVYAGDDLNMILNQAKGGDTIIISQGTYAAVNLSDKKFSEQRPLTVKAGNTGDVVVSGNSLSQGCALEIKNCSYIVFEGIAFTNALWGIYVKNSTHIILLNNEIYNTGQEGCHIGQSSKYVDVIGNKIYNTGKVRPKWAEGVYVGSGSYGRGNFPDNCEYIWIEGNHIFETGNAEAINVKSECFHITVRNNRIHDIRPGTSEQYNQAAITVEGGDNSLKNNYRIGEKRDVWVENNTIENVSGGYSDWNNGIMFFGTGVYILHNTIKNCANKGIYGNNWMNMGLQNFVFGNTVIDCGENLVIHPELKVSVSDPGKNPHSPQKWYQNH